MSVDSERTMTRKAMVYDLRNIIRETPGLEANTVQAVIKIMEDYIDCEVAAERAEN